MSPSIQTLTVLAPPPSQHAKPPPAYEFLRRKRWADLLVNELTEAVLLVFSPAYTVHYSSRTIHELLGWSDDELLDGDLLEIMNGRDRDGFRATCRGAAAHRRPLQAFVRLRCKNFCGSADAKEVLFEIYGYPLFAAEEEGECMCFYTIAKPNPSRKTATLNTMVELKRENDQLHKDLQALRSRSQELSVVQATQTGEPYDLDDMSVQIATNLGLDTSGIVRREISRTSYLAPPQPLHEEPASQPPPGPDDDGDERKKRKVVTTSEMYVCNTCGRTDSPEWRKGPRGPKTLCNACGLRWAKKVRKFEEGTGLEGIEGSQKMLDSTVLF
ncbi:hypothetical protein BV25DRAFT_1914409 [Artomyces pyxidatus]|uniref:Uncharacterized protein n=1 Tax=Artomyces pyxidatus TaxID=48021 RepID=A0ACB8T859_9AGAM|nr:hypothetical protein BV25DRAFT_1914409 [Artomyces pyxidatus]